MKKEIFDAYLQAVCKRYGLSTEEFIAKTKESVIVRARYMVFYLCHNRMMSIKEIEKYMASIGHTITHATIVRGIQSMEKQIIEDKDYANVIRSISNSVL